MLRLTGWELVWFRTLSLSAKFISHKTRPKEWGETGISGPAPAFEILRRLQQQDAFDPFSVEMPEVSGVAGQQIPGLGVNRGQQNWPVLRARRMFSASLRSCGASTMETDRSNRFRPGTASGRSIALRPRRDVHAYYLADPDGYV